MSGAGVLFYFLCFSYYLLCFRYWQNSLDHPDFNMSLCKLNFLNFGIFIST